MPSSGMLEVPARTMALSRGQRLGRYEVLGPLGAGGMGEVYRARDGQLEREVAIKVLPEGVAQDPSRLERFQREARAVARLSHPNILEIFDVGEHEGISYAVTELLEGETLREVLTGAPLPWRRAREIAAAVADGLAAAHAKGVVHRDLKPENIFVTADGRVKILDFGLARLEGPVATEAETGTLTPGDTQRGMVLGTVGYMAPEQVKGHPADARSDIFALGCVLYEMLSGKRAFLRESAVETMAAILKEDPPPFSASGVSLTPELTRSIERCLEKRPERRFQSAADLAFALRALASDSDASRAVPKPPSTLPRRVLVAAATLLAVVGLVVAGWLVLGSRRGAGSRAKPGAFARPDRVVVATFINRTGDPSLDALGLMAADVMTEGITSEQVAEVAPRSQARAAEEEIAAAATGTDPLRALGDATGAPLVVSGAYDRQGQGLAFQASVTDVAAGKLLYALDPVSAPAEGARQAVAALRSRVMSVIAIHLNPTAHSNLLSRPPTYEAYREFMTATELWADQRKALPHLQRACELDPDYFSAHLRLASCYSNLGQDDKAKEVDEALDAKRERLTPFERHWLDGMTAFGDCQYLAALGHLRTIDQMSPGDPEVKYLIASCEMSLNHPAAAVAAYEQLDTSSVERMFGPHVVIPMLAGGRARALHRLGRHREEVEFARQWLERFPDVAQVQEAEVRALAALDDLAGVDKALQRASLTTFRRGRKEDVAYTAAQELRAHGHRDAAMATAERGVEWIQESGRADEARELDLRCDLLMYAEHDAEALAACEQAVTGGVDYPELQSRIGCLEARLGDRAGALAVDRRLAALELPTQKGDTTYWRAAIAANLGDLDGAMALLRRAIAEGAAYYSDLHTNIVFDPLRGRAEFQELLKPQG